jgi:hypothetical protein
VPEVTPNPALGDLPTNQLEGQKPMDHDGDETDSVKIISPTSQRLPLSNLMGAPCSSAKLPLSSGLSNETPTVVQDGLIEMEGLTLQKGIETVDAIPDHILVDEGTPSPLKQTCGTQSKKSATQPSKKGRHLREKAEGSQCQKSQKSLGRATEEAEVLVPTVADKPQGALSSPTPDRSVSTPVVAPTS